MNVDDLLRNAFSRFRELVPEVVAGLDAEQLAERPLGRGNSIGWLVWHLARVEDSHVADVASTEQVWLAEGWQQRFGLDLPAGDTGYGHDPDEVAKVRVSAELLTGYHAAVAAQTERFLAGLTPGDLDRVVDESYTPPVTLGVRLVSVIDDCVQHIGQAGYVRGLLGD